jgi:methionyl-tRNA formyltransferase
MMPPRIIILSAGRRGIIVSARLLSAVPEAEFVLVSFREESWEPAFFDDVRQLAMSHRFEFVQSRTLARHAANPALAAPFDLLLAIGWRYVIPREFYGRARMGAYLFHDSLLPSRRGFAPSVWAMLQGDEWTGATLLQMTEGVDEGDIVAQVRVPIRAEDDISILMDRVTAAYCDIAVANIRLLLAGTAPLRPQEHSQATYGCKRLPEDNRISWKAGRTNIYNLIRACAYPYPGAFAFWMGNRIRIWSAEPPGKNIKHYSGIVPGRVVEIARSEGVRVLAGDGPLLIRQVQLDGGAAVSADSLVRTLSSTFE